MKKNLQLLKQKVKKILQEKDKKLKEPNPKPRYDDIFYKGIDWLNKQ